MIESDKNVDHKSKKMMYNLLQSLENRYGFDYKHRHVQKRYVENNRYSCTIQRSIEQLIE